MITRMQKYQFWVHHQDLPPFLLDLQSLGILHIEENPALVSPPADWANYQEARKALHFLESKAAFLPASENPPQALPPGKTASQALQWIKDWQNRHKALYQAQQALAEEIEMAEIWGDFSAEKLQALRDAGLQASALCPSQSTMAKEK
ncbi:MAG: hypothetical protein HC913_04465 [Microscillaceae bacterium]|nr:hypothetical protein [Microscillaceae bacterium]